MKKIFLSILLLLVAGFSVGLSAQNNDGCIDFTDLYGPAVTCWSGFFDDPHLHQGVVQNRHTLITHQGYDPNTGNNLPVLPEGENRVIRLGNNLSDREAEAISYRFTVDYFKSILLLKFAVVLEDPNHDPSEQPRFVVRVTNSNNQLVEECAQYDVTAAGHIPGFNSHGKVRWRPWTNLGIDLSPYIGQEVNVEFITYDCDRGAHFGYAYFTATCLENHLSFVECDDRNVILTAPDDFQSYHWDNGSTNQTCSYYVEGESLDVSCRIVSATGCQFTLNAHITVEDNLPTEDLVVYDTICLGDSYQDNYFDLPPQMDKGDFIFLNTLFDVNLCSDDTDITLFLHVTDERPQFKSDIEGLKEVHVSTNLNTGIYNYRINPISNIREYVWALSTDNWIIKPDGTECQITVLTPEKATLSVKAINSCGYDIRFIELNASFFGVDDMNEKVCDMFPNPAKDKITVVGNGIQTVEILDKYGRTVKKIGCSGSDEETIDVSDLDNAVYIVNIQYSNNRLIKQLVVAK